MRFFSFQHFVNLCLLFLWCGCFPDLVGPAPSSIGPEYVDSEGNCVDEDGCDNSVWFCSIEISSEADMATLSGCSAIGGRLTIVGDQIVSLAGLGNIAEVRGVLTVQNTSLDKLDGLTCLRSVGGLSLIDNSLLSDLGELSDVEITIVDYTPVSDGTGRGKVSIINNPLLSNLDALSGLGDEISEIAVVGNAGLSSLPELTELSRLEAITFSNNDALSSLSGIDSLEDIDDSLSIEGNESLIDLTGLDNLVSVGKVTYATITISDNTSLANLDALMHITQIDASLDVTDNPSLPSCEVKELIDYLEANTSWTADGNVDAGGNLADDCSDQI